MPTIDGISSPTSRKLPRNAALAKRAPPAGAFHEAGCPDGDGVAHCASALGTVVNVKASPPIAVSHHL
jgi:hypothetical protein